MSAPDGCRDFHVGGKLVARITPTRLYTFDALGDSECLLDEIETVSQTRLTGEKSAVIARVPGRERHPAARFSDTGEAMRLAEALLEVLEPRRQRSEP